MRTIIICAVVQPSSIRALILAVLFAAGAAHAADFEATLAIRDHKFEPAELTVPSGAKIKLSIENHDATPEEFESHELNREKVVTGNGTIIVFIGPLDPGRYPFFGDFHQETAQGVLVAK
jgi:plastocyanin